MQSNATNKESSAQPSSSDSAHPMPSVNGIPITGGNDDIDTEELRQRACTELLRQAAIAESLLPATDGTLKPGYISPAATDAIEALLERNLPIQASDESACKRYYEGHQQEFTQGERILARHILFAVTPGVNVNELRKRAETYLIDLRCENSNPEMLEKDQFAIAASELSNCPSGKNGGNLGWLQRADCAPEFASEVFGHLELGVLPTLLHSRFGFHIVEILERESGYVPPYESVQESIKQTLHQQQFITGTRQYLQLLAGKAELVGIELDASDSPLVQ